MCKRFFYFNFLLLNFYSFSMPNAPGGFASTSSEETTILNSADKKLIIALNHWGHGDMNTSNLTDIIRNTNISEDELWKTHKLTRHIDRYNKENGTVAKLSVGALLGGTFLSGLSIILAGDYESPLQVAPLILGSAIGVCGGVYDFIKARMVKKVLEAAKTRSRNGSINV